MIGADLAFPYRLRYAADILRETQVYLLGYRSLSDRTFTATELDNLAAEREANQRHRQSEQDELIRLAQQFGGSGAWTLQKAADLANAILHAGYQKESSD